MVRRVIALGFFDGVHIGHKALMDRAVQRAREKHALSTVFSFDIHPSQVLTGKAVPLLIAPQIRGEEIRRLGGVDEVVFAHFDQQMRTMPWRDFIRKLLVERWGAVHVVAGRNNHFGYRGEGTAQGMAEECQALGVGYDCIEDVKIDGVTVSSTYIRTLIADGEMERAAQFLGRPYTVDGVVSHGRQVGRLMGIPTLNLVMPTQMQCPALGVYFTNVRVGEQCYPAVTNIGRRPTFLEHSEVVVEPHLLNFSGDLYGQVAQVELLHFRRPERRFESPGQLREAVGEDTAAARRYFEERGRNVWGC